MLTESLSILALDGEELADGAGVLHSLPLWTFSFFARCESGWTQEFHFGAKACSQVRRRKLAVSISKVFISHRFSN